MTNTMNLINTIVSTGDVVCQDIYMVECGCAVNNNELEVCELHAQMSHDEIIAVIGGTNDVQPTVEEASVKEDAKSLDEMTVKELRAEAKRIGVTIPKGLLKPAIYKLLVDATTVEEVVEQQVEETVVSVDVDYGQTVAGFAKELIDITYSDCTQKQMQNMVRLNAAAILRTQQEAGTELTKNQVDAMDHHKLSASGLNSMLRTVDVNHLRKMTGIEVFNLAIKLGMKPNLVNIAPLHKELIELCSQAHAEALVKAKASEASRANNVSTPHTFKSAHLVKLFNNAVQFVADGIEYAFVITKEGKHVLRHIANQHSNYMTANYLKNMLFGINTRASRAVVQAITALVKNYSPVGGSTLKEKNSTVKKGQDNMWFSHNGERHQIPMSWYQQFVSHAKANGHTGSFPVAMIIEAWKTR